MKKLLAMLWVSALGASATAQDITPYSQYKINESVTVEIKDLKRVEKYGWDNFEITYQIKNETNYDLFKIDATLYLVDKYDQQVGVVEIHDFNIPKNSDQEYTYVDLHSPFVNEKYKKIIVVKNNLEVVLESDRQTSLAKVHCKPNLSMK